MYTTESYNFDIVIPAISTMQDSRYIPAPGWYAVFDDESTVFKLPLVCFELLYESEDLESPSHTVGLILVCPACRLNPTVSRKITRELTYADEQEEFIGYLAPGEVLEEWLKELGYE